MTGRGNWRLIGLIRDEDGDGELTEADAFRRMRERFAAGSRGFATASPYEHRAGRWVSAALRASGFRVVEPVAA